MNNQKLPNIFQFATSELSQDAAIAYILSWADPSLKGHDEKLHKLATELLQKLLESAGKKDVPTFETVVAGTQRKHVDIWVEINEDILLIIEDKTWTHEHGNQIERYLTQAKEDWREHEVVAVYLKTGNEAHASQPKGGNCGIFLRTDLLEILKKHTTINNTIVEEFLQHLESWESETNSFKKTPIGDWPGMATHGYYMWLGDWLRESHPDSRPAWSYVANAAGGFVAFYWASTKLEHQPWEFYLQIHDATELYIRMTLGEDTPVLKDDMYAAKAVLESIAQNSDFERLQLKKAGRYRGGNTATVMQIEFDDQPDHRACKDDGRIDLLATKERLEIAMNLLSAARAQRQIM